MTSYDKNEFTFNVTDVVRSSIHIGDKIEVERNGAVYDGKITSIANIPGNISGLYPVEAILNDNGAITIGSTAKVTFVSEKVEDVFVINTKNIYYDGGNSYIYTVSYSNENIDADKIIDEGNKYGIIHKVKIDRGVSDETNTQILSEIDENTMIVDSWTSQLYEGGKVQVKETKEETNE
jgi:hypothetical protein